LTTKRIVCLANSRKLSGRCIAGRELLHGNPGSWIRPVSDRPHQEVSEHERHYAAGTVPQILDLIDVPLIVHRPDSYQTENWMLDPDVYWELAGRTTWDELGDLADDPPALWVNASSTGVGANDRVAIGDADQLTNSLYLLSLEILDLRVFAPGRAFRNTKRRVQAAFAHRGAEYRLWVTDPVIERDYLKGDDGKYRLGPCFVTISLGEPHEEYCYKLVAAIITPGSSTGTGA